MDLLYPVCEFVIGMHDRAFGAKARRVDLELRSESRRFSLLISEAQQAGDISTDLDQATTARLLLAILLGMELRKTMEPDLKLDRFLPIIRALLTAFR